jgi:hypothetical protein
MFEKSTMPIDVSGKKMFGKSTSLTEACHSASSLFSRKYGDDVFPGKVK